MAILNANDFAARTFFISEEEEEMLRQGESLMVEANVNFVGYWDGDNTQEFVGVAAMLDSHADQVKELAFWEDGEAVIDTDDLQSSSIPSLTVSNNRDMGIINVRKEEYESLAPGDRVKVEVSLGTDAEGNEYLNGRNLKRLQPKEAKGSGRSSLVEEEQRAEAAA
jgi:hypothetical protein